MEINVTDFRPVVGIVTYHPSKETCARIQLLADKQIPFLVFDNTPGEALWPACYGNRIIRRGENLGLGVALKALDARAFEDSYSHMLYFDEDIVFDESTLSWIHRWYNHHHPGDDVGLIWFDYNEKGEKSPQQSLAYPIKIAVSACSLINLKAANDIGGHTDRWFLEGIDYDFCFRLVQRGYKLLGVDHSPGINPFANQPGIYFTDAKGRRSLVRVQPMKRLWNFWGALLDLGWRALKQGPRSYVYLFYRNIFTYAYDQVSAIVRTYWIWIWKK
jgi:rhamnosyltransferase